jgi:topoisomerase IA-like protein
VTARNGKYGSYVQAVRIHKDGSPVKSAKPVNMTLPKDGGLTEDTVTLQDAEQMFSEVKLPRQLGDGFFTGIGKRGAWLGHKNAPRGRAVFISLPDGEDPRALSPDRAKEIWDDYQKDHPARRKPASGRVSRKR